MKIQFLKLLSLMLLFVNCAKEIKKISNHENTNELIKETSPYLLQHAYNPVNWKAWNTATLAEAKKKNKLMIISVGYAACHGVMLWKKRVLKIPWWHKP